jgi:hypothetical protein
VSPWAEQRRQHINGSATPGWTSYFQFHGGGGGPGTAVPMVVCVLWAVVVGSKVCCRVPGAAHMGAAVAVLCVCSPICVFL